MLHTIARLTLCTLIILGVSLTAVPVQVRAQSATGGTVIADVNVRTGPGTGYSVITHLPIKTRVEIEGRTAANDWILLHTADNSVRGWAATYFVQLDPEFSWAPIPVSDEIIGGAPQAAGSGQAEPVPAEDNSGTVLASFLRVRSGPTATSAEVASVGRGAVVILEARDAGGDWLLVHTRDNGIRGWVAAGYVKTRAAVNALPVSGEAVSGKSAADSASEAAYVLDGNEPALANNIVITIDDCSVEANVRFAYNILHARGLSATFFPNTINILTQDPQLWKDIAANMEIGYHTRAHMSGLTPAELDYDFGMFTQEIRTLIGDPNYTIHYVRPPRGEWDSNWLSWAASRGLYTVKWNMYSQTTMASISQTARDRVGGGSILIMHTGDDDLQWLNAWIDALMQLTDAQGVPFKIRSVGAAMGD